MLTFHCTNNLGYIHFDINKFRAIISQPSVSIEKNKYYCIEYSYELTNRKRKRE